MTNPNIASIPFETSTPESSPRHPATGNKEKVSESNGDSQSRSNEATHPSAHKSPEGSKDTEKSKSNDAGKNSGDNQPSALVQTVMNTEKAYREKPFLFIGGALLVGFILGRRR